ncbi:hypothetical protein ASPVEDRAFT_890110 [Aspergillus versicolor CBS 583.65]|uniref:Carrier domain-containing protein n=1 Tax=Aspergillus versicolor CBS 583.65 TaxID=1036611 RepID=A0A1L9PPK5_ASPVE|nr:uncharacterized protein ASPVEDRAFT_890110 [Aspergillus versicolor CBS 583.65]OJJ03392.1 hypothetical protein ASPVEDRAFT_890110 [Aspergillus versicolor CBS 583.65]
MGLSNLTLLLEAAAGQGGSGNVVCYAPHNTRQPTFHSYHRFPRGRVVLIHFDTHWENILWFWAVLLAGCVPAMSTALSNNPTARILHLEHLVSLLQGPGCLTAASKLAEFGYQDGIMPTAVESLSSDMGNASAAELDNVHRTAGADELAFLMITSGSTSHAKAVMFTHGQVFTALASKYEVMPLPERSSFLNWVRCDHVEAILEIHLQAMFARKDQVHVQALDVLSQPHAFLDIVDRHRVSRTFAPNFFLARMRTMLEGHGAEEPNRWDLSCLRYIVSGGEAVVIKTAADVETLLTRYGAPAKTIFPGFGMTETCGGAIYNMHFPQYDTDRGLEFASLGKCVPGLSMRVSRIADDQAAAVIAPPGTAGNLELTGSLIFPGYFNSPEANRKSFTHDGWFRTGDLASIDDPQEIETALEEAGKVPGLVPGFTCCLSAFPPRGETETVCVVYLPAYSPDDTAARVATADAIARIAMMATGSRPQVLPLDQSKLQKSALGKLCRTKIKTAFENGDYASYQEANSNAIKLHRATTRVHPASELEERLLALFRASLELPEEFDVQSSLFDIGITSVDLIRLKKLVEERLGLAHEIPIVSLMVNPTVRGLATVLEDGRCRRPSGEYNPVVTLQSQGEKTPLWLVHPGVGEVLVFLNLAKFLVDRPVYALRARGFNEGEQPFETIDQVVRTYHAAIKQQQPQGPYAIAGYSYGTIFAFEIGKVLEANGDSVRFLGSFNLPPHINARMRQLDYQECLLHLSYFLGLMTEDRARELAVALKAKGATREEALARVLADAHQARLDELGLSPAGLTKWASLAFALQRMAVDYDPSGSIAGIDIFYCNPLAVAAASKAQWRSEHLSRWEAFSRSEPRFHDLGGAHYTMLGPEHVFGFQKTLRRALEARGI